MSQENVEVIRRGYAHFLAAGDLLEEIVAPDFVWDMSRFGGWLEQQVYEGIEGTRTFIRDWTEAWDDWELEVLSVHDAGDEVVTVVRQRARSKATGLPVDMTFAQVWSVRDGQQTRMRMYAQPEDAFQAAGLPSGHGESR
jgi:ketosteroid isomerase-like protein